MGKVLGVVDDNVLTDCTVVLVRTEGPLNLGKLRCGLEREYSLLHRLFPLHCISFT